ncbi:uncharacterized protein LAESUDRAFT_721199 [Laetiporus sulphureus 93-53]|uniref:Zinc finger PHD-type domain-containing protein n=1 Tax=Laetiporus sulphureus 93-53 TaxID=1314785 RepID=A0A165GU40_9APHY|nr:uncharacterized protein LAESUDRAFT_721199 [Laetiporus sulphureus 93-53]KZT10813.1 hypothetical protein LAESUDRAFT_721199 [Laetiporus sulphureus 93-53]
MANVAVMGPPPSPKEPRRSGRRSAPSASKSPAGSPAADTGPKAKENSIRPALTTSNSSNKSKRSKQDDHDDVLEDVRKNGVNGNGNGRAKRKGRDKEKLSDVANGDSHDDIAYVDAPGAEAAADAEGENEETGVTRCICGEEDSDAAGDAMVQCDLCEAWQHCLCMGYPAVEAIPDEHYCEVCRPDLYVDLLKKHAKRARQSSTNSHHTAAANPSRASRSHSPIIQPKPTKRRNTMNSRDAAYEDSVQALIEATAAEAAAAAAAQEAADTPVVNGTGSDVNGHAGAEQDPLTAPSSRRKRKRSDDDAVASKRTRSASIASDRTTVANAIARDPTPVVNNVNIKNTPAPASTAKNPRNRRTNARKAQAQDLVLGEGEEVVPTSARKQANNRSKATTGNDHGGRRAQANSVTGAGGNLGSHANSSAVSRAYYHSHAYALSQQPLYTSWGLPDHLAHLEPMLPSETPRPLEVRGSGVDPNGRESLERTTERGVKVKWPAKRMSVGDMNKRVRALVEWVGREQASALERSRRRESLEKALKDARASNEEEPRQDGDTQVSENGNTLPIAVENVPLTDSPLQEKQLNLLDGILSIPQESKPPSSSPPTMKLMEELMEELIDFQERFGPGAKTKERERRTVTS